jgi:addiction module HigA family antidote
MAKQKLVLPGDVLKTKMDEYLVSIGKLTEDIKISQSMIRQILAGKAKISLPLALKLAKYFNTTFEFWSGIQAAYDYAEIKKDGSLAQEIKEIPKAKKPSSKALAAANSAKTVKDKAVSRRGAKKEEPVKQGRRSAKDAAVRASDKSDKPASTRRKETGGAKSARRSRKPAAEDPSAGEQISPVVTAKVPDSTPKRVSVRRRRPAAKKAPVEIVEEKPKKELEVILIKKSRQVEEIEDGQQESPVPATMDSDSVEPTLFDEDVSNTEE